MKKLMVIITSFILFGCSSSRIPIPATEYIDLQNVNYSYFEIVYNDATFLSQISKKLADEKWDQARIMSEVYVSQRRNLYNSVEKEVYNNLSKTYNKQTSDLLKNTLNEFHDLIWKLDKIVFETNFNYKTSMDIYTRIGDLEKYIFLYSNKSTNVSLSLLNIVFYPEQNFKKHGLDQIIIFIKEFQQQVEELNDFLDNV